MPISKTIPALVKEIELWLRLATFLHEPLKFFLLYILHNLAQDPSYTGLPQNPQQLYQEFSNRNNQKKIQKLVNKKVLKKDQLELILPNNANATDSDKFDVTLICILIRNFTNLPAPQNGWDDKNPSPTDTSIAAFVIRAREWRNFLHHEEPKDITLTIFNQKWKEGEQTVNNLGFTYPTNKLKTISLDPKHETVSKSIFSYLAQLNRKQDALAQQHKTTNQDVENFTRQLNSTNQNVTNLIQQQSMADKNILCLTQQLSATDQNVANLTQKLDQNLTDLNHHLSLKASQTPQTACCCTEKCLQHLSKALNSNEVKRLVKQLGLVGEYVHQNDLAEMLKDIPWLDIRQSLEWMNHYDIVEYLQQNTLITKVLQNASSKLRRHYIKELCECLNEKPLSPYDEDTDLKLREEVFIDLVVLQASAVDKEWSNSDRDTIMKQPSYPENVKYHSIHEIITRKDQLVIIRGAAGMGKSTLLNMFTLKWAKNELDTKDNNFEFVFQFDCRDLNMIADEFSNLEELFKLKYPEVFDDIDFKDLIEISDRVLVIVDGVDELNGIYMNDIINNHNFFEEEIQNEKDQTPKRLQSTILQLINPKSQWLKNHKAILCGRPKACEYAKGKITNDLNRKTVEICGFNEKNIKKYIRNFFGDDDQADKKATVVQRLLDQNLNLRFMARVPIFLYVICCVYDEDLIRYPINTSTELYVYITIVFLRNHMRKKNCHQSKQFDTLMSVIENETIIKALYSLMELSVKTYMKNQVVFQETDIEWLDPSLHLEETGFIVKSRPNCLKAALYQFRHLVLQEYFTALYLVVSKDITPFVTNRELSSCKPTILGILRMLKLRDNCIFLALYDQLNKIHQSKKRKNTSIDIFTEFVGAFLSLPTYMIQDDKKTLVINTRRCSEFLALFVESRDSLIAPPLKSVIIHIDYSYKNIHHIVSLLKEMNITNILRLDIDKCDFSAEQRYLISLAIGEKYETWTLIGEMYAFGYQFTQGRITADDVDYLSYIPEDIIQNSNAINADMVLFSNNDTDLEIKQFFQKTVKYQKPITVKCDIERQGKIRQIIHDIGIDFGKNDITFCEYDQDSICDEDEEHKNNEMIEFETIPTEEVAIYHTHQSCTIVYNDVSVEKNEFNSVHREQPTTKKCCSFCSLM